MDWDIILAAAKGALSSLEGVAVTQGAQLLVSFTKAIPAIKAGVASAEPFLVSEFNLLTHRTTGVPADEWDAQLAMMQAQLNTVDAQVAKDEEDQP